MRIDTEDQLTYTRYKVLLDTAIGAGLKTLDSMVTIYDINDEEQQLTIRDFYELLLAYGAYCETLYRQNSRLRKAIREAKTVAELEAILLPE